VKELREKNLKELRAIVSRLALVLKGSDVNLTHIPAATCWFERKDSTTMQKFGIAYRIPLNMEKAETRTLKEAITDPKGLKHVSGLPWGNPKPP
jgi:hypothetical protein